MPQLEDEDDDELGIGSFVANLGRDDAKNGANTPAGVDLLHMGGNGDEPDANVTSLINIVTGKDKSVPVPGPIPGSKAVLERDQVRDALNSAVITGAKEKKRDDNEEDKRHAPKEALRAATTQVTKADDVVKSAAGTPDFDSQTRKVVEIAYRKLKKSMKNLDATMTRAGVIGE